PCTVLRPEWDEPAQRMAPPGDGAPGAVRVGFDLELVDRGTRGPHPGPSAGARLPQCVRRTAVAADAGHAGALARLRGGGAGHRSADAPRRRPVRGRGLRAVAGARDAVVPLFADLRARHAGTAGWPHVRTR